MQISTDEVYGSIDPPHDADENYPLRASSPYSASKTGADMLALSYFVTYKMRGRQTLTVLINFLKN